MLLSKIRLTNIRCFEDVEFDLAAQGDGHPARFALLVGNNGAGKTTALRCIALGLCDEGDAAGLLSELYGDFVRDKTKPATITIDVKAHATDDPVQITTTIEVHQEKNYAISRPKDYVDLVGRDIFICGYGARRGVYGTRDYSEYAPVDAIYSLFNYEMNLQNAELALRRRGRRSKAAEKQICAWLATILMLPVNGIALKDQGIVVRAKGDTYRPLAASADGYQATITWLLDVLGWALLAGKGKERTRVRGLILIDELEQHLHPEWQRYIVALLYRQLPNVQFIAASHSPLCAAGLADLPKKDSYLGVLKVSGGAVSSIDLEPLPGWRYDQVLTSEAFGLSLARNPVTEELIRTVRRQKPESADFRSAIKKLRSQSLSAAEDEEDRALRQTLTVELKHINELLSKKDKE